MPIKELTDAEKRQQNRGNQNPDRINLFTVKFLERWPLGLNAGETRQPFCGLGPTRLFATISRGNQGADS